LIGKPTVPVILNYHSKTIFDWKTYCTCNIMGFTLLFYLPISLFLLNYTIFKTFSFYFSAISFLTKQLNIQFYFLIISLFSTYFLYFFFKTKQIIREIVGFTVNGTLNGFADTLFLPIFIPLVELNLSF